MKKRAQYNFKYNPNSQGMALVTVIIFAAVAMLVITAAVSMGILSSMSSRQMLQGQHALLLAESGAENALLRLLRNPVYTGETLTMDGGTATIVVSGTNPKIISVEGKSGSIIRQIEVRVSDTSGAMSVDSWQEKF